MNDAIKLYDNIEAMPWDILTDEPVEWHERFLTFYCALGFSRSLRKAFLLHQSYMGDLAVECPPASEWTIAARKFEWKRRATAWDQNARLEVLKRVEQAKHDLMELSVDAVEALGDSLKVPRTRVSGAKAILDRAGLPAASEVQHKVVPYSGDELNQAAEELEEWEKQLTKGSSGSNVVDQ